MTAAETLPDGRGYFGVYGGMFVPETLMSPLQELARAYECARNDSSFQEELATLLRGAPFRVRPVADILPSASLVKIKPSFGWP